MSYEVLFRDKNTPSVIVQNDRGERLKELLMSNKPSTTPVDIDGEIHRLYDISAIRKTTTNDRIPVVSLDKLLVGGKCKGKNSIQKEINDTIRLKYPKQWPQYIKDTVYRESLRQQIRSSDNSIRWCDYREDECAC